ncbi:hypothetical protein C8D91_1572 [Marinicella litoralis]|uniref:Permease n=2 Tax=Marinicella litoralis TaxID=644220 RepID=A0A4R6XVU8_9GAMM|nr:hypothetical protein C8D91_1572 [Marinicella litoralis]
MSMEAAPWLVLGLVIGGLFKSLIPTAFLHKHLTQPGLASIIKAAILGIPLPLCSCGVIPAAIGLRQAGASKPATTSFLVSTPETGVDSISISYAMMGPFMTIIRPVAALFSALFTGLLVMLFAGEESPQQAKQKQSASPSCCASSAEKSQQEAPPQGILKSAWDGIYYAFSDLYPSILKWLVIGLLFAAAVQAFVAEDWLLQWGDSWLVMFMMLLIGIPMYVCATGSTPIAAGFLMAGISPGAVLVYLLAGPATNIATLGVVREQMGNKTMWLYLLGIIGSALFMGVLVNVFASQFEINSQINHSHEFMPYILQLLSLLLLVWVALMPLFNKAIKKDQSSCCD